MKHSRHGERKKLTNQGLLRVRVEPLYLNLSARCKGNGRVALGGLEQHNAGPSPTRVDLDSTAPNRYRGTATLSSHTKTMAPSLANLPIETLSLILRQFCLHCTKAHDYDSPDGYFRSSKLGSNSIPTNCRGTRATTAWPSILCA